MPYSNQDPDTETVMAIFRQERDSRMWSYKDVADQLREVFSYDIRPDEYRACEQNLTRKVPLVLVIKCAHLFQLHAEDLLPMLDIDEYRRYG